MDATSAVLPSDPVARPSNIPITPSTMATPSAGATRAKRPLDTILTHQPRVQVIRGGTGDFAMVHGIDEVWAHFEALHMYPATAQRPQDTQ